MSTSPSPSPPTYEELAERYARREELELEFNSGWDFVDNNQRSTRRLLAGVLRILQTVPLHDFESDTRETLSEATDLLLDVIVRLDHQMTQVEKVLDAYHEPEAV